MIEWHELDIKIVLKELGTSKNGLSPEESATRLQKYGFNELKEEKKTTPFEIFLRQFTNFLVLILIAATIFSAFIGELLDSAAILIIVILNAIFGFLQEYKAEKSMEALKKMASQESVVIRNGKQQKTQSRLLVLGDIVILEQGDKVPADARLIEVYEFKIDESAITGESVPVRKITAACKTNTLAEMKCMAFMGTIVTYGRAVAVIVNTGMATEVGKIAHIVQTAKAEQTPLQKSLDKFGKRLSTLIIVISAIIIVTGLLRGNGLAETILIGIALAVAAIPEGLPAVVTITLAIGMQRMAKKNAIIRKLHAVETLGSVSVICADKTGTLTRNEMTIRKIWTSYKIIDVTGKGYEPAGEFFLGAEKIEKNEPLSMLLSYGALCTNAQLRKTGTDEQGESSRDEWSIIGDPTEGAIIVTAKKFGLEKESLEKESPRKSEIPFTSERKMMSTIHSQKDSYVMCTKGAAEVILTLCSKMQFGEKTIRLTEKEKNVILDTNKEMASNALRVLAIAYKKTDKPKAKENELIFLGLVGMIDPPRQEVTEDIKTCMDAGIKTVMITGDHKNTAVAIARELGMPEGNVLTGEELESMNDAGLENIAGDVNIYARVNPEHKARIVDALKKKNHIIAMTGDGINDAPALKKADIGVAMGIKGTDVAKEASDMVLADDNFSSIVSAVKEGRNIYDNIKSFILYLLSSNMAEVMIVFAALIIGFTAEGRSILPLTAIQLLWINLVTDGLPALALGIDPPVQDIMKRKPRDPKERLLSKKMLTNMLITGVIIAALVLAIFTSYISDPSRAVTMAFTSLVLFEMINAMRVRLENGHMLFSNRKLIAAIASSVLLQLLVIYTSALQPIFDTVPLTGSDWGIIVIGLIVLSAVSYIRLRITNNAERNPKI